MTKPAVLKTCHYGLLHFSKVGVGSILSHFLTISAQEASLDIRVLGDTMFYILVAKGRKTCSSLGLDLHAFIAYHEVI